MSCKQQCYVYLITGYKTACRSTNNANNDQRQRFYQCYVLTARVILGELSIIQMLSEVWTVLNTESIQTHSLIPLQVMLQAHIKIV